MNPQQLEHACCPVMRRKLEAANSLRISEQISRNAVIEECARICAAQGEEWDSDAQVTEKNYAAFCATRLRALKSRPAAPDPRDEALRLAKEALEHAQNQPYPFGNLELFHEALAAIGGALEGRE